MATTELGTETRWKEGREGGNLKTQEGFSSGDNEFDARALTLTLKLSDSVKKITSNNQIIVQCLLRH